MLADHRNTTRYGRVHYDAASLMSLLSAQMMSLDRVFGADASSRDGFTSAAASTGNCNRSNSSATAAAAAAAAAAKEQQSWHLTQMPYIPWDWSVKSSVR